MIDTQEEATHQRLLLSNYLVCHCGEHSPTSSSWWKVQDWWREHGYGRKCA